VRGSCRCQLWLAPCAELTAVCGAPAAAQQIVFGHQNFEYVLPGNIRATFLWAPYGANLTAHFREWCAARPDLFWPRVWGYAAASAAWPLARRVRGIATESARPGVRGRGEGPVVPDAIVLSAGLWHMLHVTDVTGFAAELARLKAAALGLLAQAVQVPGARPLPCVCCVPLAALFRHAAARQAPPISYFSISEVYPPKLKTEEKRQHLTPAGVDAYNLAIATRAVLAPAGPLHLVDIHGLTHGARALAVPPQAVLRSCKRRAKSDLMNPEWLRLRRVRPGVHARRPALLQRDVRQRGASVGQHAARPPLAPRPAGFRGRGRRRRRLRAAARAPRAWRHLFSLFVR